MKIKLQKTPEQIELFKLVGSRKRLESSEAQEILAAFLSDVVLQVLQQSSTSSMIYTDMEYDEDDSPSIPLDLYYDQNATGYVTVWSQTMAGGLPASQDISVVQEMKIAPYNLNSAISIPKAYARKARLDVIAKYLERHAQEILVKTERNAWAVVLKALAEGSTNTTRNLDKGLGYTSAVSTTHGSSYNHVIRSLSDGTFQLADLSSLITRIKRINSSWNGGTAVEPYSRGITDLFVSPEVKQDIRAFAYNPMSTVAAGQVAVNSATSDNAGIALPDSIRTQIFNSAGMDNIFGVNIIDLNELGTGQKYNILFDTFAGSTSYTRADGTNGSTFAAASDEILIGVDNTRDAFLRPVAVQSESGSQLMTVPDDQYVSRQDKFGWYSMLEEGRVCVDSRAVVGIMVG